MMKEKNNTLLIYILIIILILVIGVFVFVAITSLTPKPASAPQPPSQSSPPSEITEPTLIEDTPILPEQKPLETFTDPIPNEVPPRSPDKIVVSSIMFGPESTIREVILLLPQNFEKSTVYLNEERVNLITASEPDLIASIQVPTDQPLSAISIKFLIGDEIAATCNISAGEMVELSGDCIW